MAKACIRMTLEQAEITFARIRMEKAYPRMTFVRIQLGNHRPG